MKPANAHFPIRLFGILMLATCSVPAFATERPSNPIEAGDVRWGRDFDAALEKSGQSGKPVLVLFQEIPGCSGVQKFGRTVLTNPSLVKAIETEFIPVLVYNNRTGGVDGELLKRYREPSWNYQVIRFLDSSGRDVIPRKDRVWTTEGVASRMAESLRATGRPVPDYLQDLSGGHSGDSDTR